MSHVCKKGQAHVPRHVMICLGGALPPSPQNGAQHSTNYMEWLSSLGDAVMSSMNPFKNTRTAHSDGSVPLGSTFSISRYTVIQTASMDATLTFAEAYPGLVFGSALEVSRLADLMEQG